MNYYLMNTLVDDVCSYLLSFMDHNVTLIVLSNVNKKFYFLCSEYGRKNNIKKNLICCNIATIGYLEVLKWARENGCEWDDNTKRIALQKWPDEFQ